MIKKYLGYLALAFCCMPSLAQVNLNANAPLPQVRGIAQTQSGGLGISTLSLTGCPKEVSGTWTVTSGNCAAAVSGFPIVIGSTSIAATSTTTALNGLTVNGVTLNSAGSSSLFLNQAGSYTSPGSGSSGFPITLGSTSVASSSTTTALAGLTVNGVTLTAAGSSTLFLNQAGGYTSPSGSSGFPIVLGSTSIGSGSTTTAVTGLSVNGVTLTAAGSATSYLNATGGYTTPAGTGTVTTVSVATANGFQGTVANPTTTPAITVNVDSTHVLPTNTGSSTTFLNGAGAYTTPAGSSGITQLTGDVTAGPGSGSQAATLATSGVTAGTYTNANITVDAKGRVTVAANGSGGASGISGLTAGYLPLAGSATTINANSPCDFGVTTAGVLTCTAPTTITGSTHGITIPAGTPRAGAAGSVVYTSDATNGYGEINENATGLARICTVSNNVCPPGTTLPTNALVYGLSSTTSRAASAADFAPANYAVASGSVNALAIAVTPTPGALAAGTEFDFLPNLANTSTTPTLNAGVGGAITITKGGASALAVGDLTTTAVAKVIYDGTHYQLQNPQSVAGGSVVSSINSTSGAFTFTGNVSCTGTSCSFGSTFSTTYILVSELGCAAQNTNLNTGGGTDDTTCINNALSLATTSHPVVLIQDGASLISGSAGLHGPAGGNWGIIGLGGGVSDTGTVSGTGFFFANGSNGDVISNGVTPISGVCGDPATTPPARGVNILLKSFVVNGNGSNQTAYCYIIDIQNMEHVVIDDVTAYLSHTYSVRLDNVGVSVVTNTKLEPLTPTDTSNPLGVHTDGIHIDGPANDITISNIYCHVSDDCIALNAPEGYCGAIQRVAITNVTLFDTANFLRMYGLHAGTCAVSGLASTVDYVSASNIVGSTYISNIIVGQELVQTQTNIDIVNHFVMDNSNLSGFPSANGPDNVNIYQNAGSLAFHYDWTPVPSNVGGHCTNCGFVMVGYNSATVDELDLSGSNIVQNGNAAGTGGMVDTVDSISGTPTVTFKSIILDNVGVKNIGPFGGAPTPISFAIYNTSGSSIGNVRYSNVSPNFTGIYVVAPSTETAGSYGPWATTGFVYNQNAFLNQPTFNGASTATDMVQNFTMPGGVHANAGLRSGSDLGNYSIVANDGTIWDVGAGFLYTNGIFGGRFGEAMKIGSFVTRGTGTPWASTAFSGAQDSNNGTADSGPWRGYYAANHNIAFNVSNGGVPSNCTTAEVLRYVKDDGETGGAVIGAVDTNGNLCGWNNIFAVGGTFTGPVSAKQFAPTTIYSAAGTALPTCTTGLKGYETVVSDATTPTYLGTYTSGGAVVAPVMCNGSAWVTY